MTEAIMLELIHRFFSQVMYFCIPILTASLLVGIVVGIFQAATQIQENTLSFFPKLLTLIIGLSFFGRIATESLVHYTTETLLKLAYIGPKNKQGRP